MRNTEWIRALVTLDPGKVWPAANEVIVVGAISLTPLILASLGNNFGSVVNSLVACDFDLKISACI